jgi:hypothetical protein
MDNKVKPAFTQRFAIALLTDNDVTAKELGEVLTALGYHGVWVQYRDEKEHEHPCPSSKCCEQLRTMGHIISEDVVCCDCWWDSNEERSKQL